MGDEVRCGALGLLSRVSSPGLLGPVLHVLWDSQQARGWKARCQESKEELGELRKQTEDAGWA